MKAYLAMQPGGPESLRLIETDKPIPGPEEVLVRVAAIGVNRVDAMQRSGAYPPPRGANNILGVECAGEVVGTGEQVETPSVGTRVIALVPAGAYAEFVAVHYSHTVETPADWTDAQAAAVIETFCTAHETVFELGRLKPGERALIHAVGSAVGSTAVRMASLRGAEVIGTAGSTEKVAQGLSIGARHVINYKEVDFAEELLRIWPEGVDFIEDFVGPAYFSRHLKVARWLGRITMVGLLSQGASNTDTAPIIGKRLSINGFTLRPQSIAEKTAIVGRFRDIWMPELSAGSIAPIIYAEVPFEQAEESHRIIEENRNFGKVILTI
ncbi:NAD(P)H-quinone oxidoreductase [Vreelandella titanicae]|uniref:NAD(P)H-quinone oxidoreductase n=1 Tax=Vreelandella titanicae TaxID=664683 RepID=UPI0031599FDF